MKFRIAALALLVATDAFAQTPAPPAPQVEQAAPVAPAAPQKFYLELDPSDLQSLSQAIMELPKRIADPLILKINGQLSKQPAIDSLAQKAPRAKE